MIRITKQAEPPDVLRKQGTQRRRTHCSNYTRFAEDYESGKRTFPFDYEIYGHPSVKEALISAQHGKCCYCETIIDNDGDIEHYRPKAGYCQDENSVLIRPGYYWLAYEWDNLLLSCHICNQRHKRSFFPITDPTQRARNHHEELSREEPILIHPGHINPQEHILFDWYTSVAVNDSEHGEKNIELLGLNRASLRDRRLARLKELAFLRKILDIEPADEQQRQMIAEAQQFLANAVTDRAEFASMARCASKRDFRFGKP